jgi:hypothetical protein
MVSPDPSIHAGLSNAFLSTGMPVTFKVSRHCYLGQDLGMVVEHFFFVIFA